MILISTHGRFWLASRDRTENFAGDDKMSHNYTSLNNSDQDGSILTHEGEPPNRTHSMENSGSGVSEHEAILGTSESVRGTETATREIVVVLPVFSIALIISTIFVFAFCDYSDCSAPLGQWILMFVARQILKSLLYGLRSRLTLIGRVPSNRLLWLISMTDLAGPTLWSLGGYFIFHTESCDSGIFTYACILWGLQSIGLLLPCCFLSILVFCAPCLLWLAPYIVRPNPNTVATGREVMAKIPKTMYSALPVGADINTSCTICLNDYVPEDEVMKLPCGHVFHSGCIESWLNVSQLCPVDRTNVATMLSTQADPEPPV